MSHKFHFHYDLQILIDSYNSLQEENLESTQQKE